MMAVTHTHTHACSIYAGRDTARGWESGAAVVSRAVRRIWCRWSLITALHWTTHIGSPTHERSPPKLPACSPWSPSVWLCMLQRSMVVCWWPDIHDADASDSRHLPTDTCRQTDRQTDGQTNAMVRHCRLAWLQSSACVWRTHAYLQSFRFSHFYTVSQNIYIYIGDMSITSPDIDREF